MATLPLTRGLVAVIDDADLPWLSRWKWRLLRSAPNILYPGRRAASGEIRLHRLIMDAQPGQIVDHINGDTLDNRRCNLRIATAAGNAQNRRKSSGAKKSRFKGVAPYLGSKSRPWYALIRVDGKVLYLGAFADEADAARAYDQAALTHFGEYARTNFPNGGGLYVRSGG